MTEYPIRIRISSASAGDYETNTYTDSTFAEAVAALQGVHDVENDYHRMEVVYIVATYAQDHIEHHGPRAVERKAGEPIFGYEATIHGRDISFGSANDCEVGWASMGYCSTDKSGLMIDIYRVAVEIAKAANAEPFCSGCQAELDRYARLERS